MPMSLSLPAELEQRLAHEADRLGITPSECAARVLDQYLPALQRRQKLVSIIQSWIDEDDGGEQKETGDFLIRALDEDRPSERKLFPAEMEGASW